MSDPTHKPVATGTRKIPDIDSQIPHPDGDAGREERAILSDDYADDEKRQDHRRKQGIKNVSYWATIALVWAGVVLIIGTTGVWAIHILAPTRFRWLSPDEVNRVQALLFSGALSAALTLLGKKFL